MAGDTFNQPGNVRKNVDWYIYGGTVSGLTTSGIASSNIAIEADADFFASKLTYFATLSTNAAITWSTTQLPLVRLQINDGGSGRNLFNTPLALPTLAGSGELPYIIPIDRVFMRNSVITLSWSCYVAAGTTYNIDFAFHGIKRWS